MWLITELANHGIIPSVHHWNRAYTDDKPLIIKGPWEWRIHPEYGTLTHMANYSWLSRRYPDFVRPTITTDGIRTLQILPRAFSLPHLRSEAVNLTNTLITTAKNNKLIYPNELERVIEHLAIDDWYQRTGPKFLNSVAKLTGIRFPVSNRSYQVFKAILEKYKTWTLFKGLTITYRGLPDKLEFQLDFAKLAIERGLDFSANRVTSRGREILSKLTP